jgi:hypothetical protein
MALVEDLDGLVAALGPGLVARLGWDAAMDPALAVVLRVSSRDASQAALARLFRDALVPGQTFEQERSPEGLVTCPRKGSSPPAFCVALGVDRLTFATSRAALAGGRPEPGTAGAADGGPASPALVAELNGGSGGFVGRWSLEP